MYKHSTTVAHSKGNKTLHCVLHVPCPCLKLCWKLIKMVVMSIRSARLTILTLLCSNITISLVSLQGQQCNSELLTPLFIPSIFYCGHLRTPMLFNLIFLCPYGTQMKQLFFFPFAHQHWKSEIPNVATGHYLSHKPVQEQILKRVVSERPCGVKKTNKQKKTCPINNIDR